MNFPGRDARFVGATAAALLLAAVSIAAFGLAEALGNAREPLGAIEARYARLAGLKEVRDQVERGVADVGEVLARHTYPASSGTDRIGTDLQQRVRRVAESAGMGVTGSQILPVRAANGLSQIPVAVTVEGSLEGLRAMLAALGQEIPSIHIDSIVIQTRMRRRLRGAPPDQRLSAQMNLSVLHLQQ
ncbi:type II secretion system protein GspM [Azoarcus sp. PA01]|nr:type II secretion system protein GspM [Azoarcus sp. PA01]